MEGSSDLEILGRDDRDAPVRSWRDTGARFLVLAALLGAAAGAYGMRTWDARPPAQRPPAEVIDVRVSLGAHSGGLLDTERGKAVLSVDTVVLNNGSQDLELVAVKVAGPGAGFLPEVAGGPSTALPVALPRGQFVNVRFGLSSDCAVVLRPLPTVTLVVRDPAGGEHDVVTTIPDLDAIWGQSLDPEACPVLY